MRPRFLIVCFAMFAAVCPGRAVTDMFLKLGDIKGESRDQAHKEEIDVLAWSWGMSSTYSTLTATGKVNLNDLHLTKFVDRATPALMLSCANGRPIPGGLLTCRRAGPNPLEFIKISLSNMLVTAVSEGTSSGGDRPLENVSLNFGKIEFDYFVIEGTTTRNTYFTWDVARNTGSGGGTDGTLDTDRDGMPDSFENAHGLNRLVNDAAADKDGDGMSNLDEYLAGTSPSDRNSIFRCKLAYRKGDPSATLSWNSVAGREYRVMYTENPGTPLNILGNYMAATGAVTQITIPVNLARRFYRVQVKQLP